MLSNLNELNGGLQQRHVLMKCVKYINRDNDNLMENPQPLFFLSFAHHCFDSCAFGTERAG